MCLTESAAPLRHELSRREREREREGGREGGVRNVSKSATLCISISPTTGWATGQTENMCCVSKFSVVKMNLR